VPLFQDSTTLISSEVLKKLKEIEDPKTLARETLRGVFTAQELLEGNLSGRKGKKKLDSQKFEDTIGNPNLKNLIFFFDSN